MRSTRKLMAALSAFMPLALVASGQTSPMLPRTMRTDPGQQRPLAQGQSRPALLDLSSQARDRRPGQILAGDPAPMIPDDLPAETLAQSAEIPDPSSGLLSDPQPAPQTNPEHTEPRADAAAIEPSLDSSAQFARPDAEPDHIAQHQMPQSELAHSGASQPVISHSAHSDAAIGVSKGDWQTSSPLSDPESDLESDPTYLALLARREEDSDSDSAVRIIDLGVVPPNSEPSPDPLPVAAAFTGPTIAVEPDRLPEPSQLSEPSQPSESDQLAQQPESLPASALPQHSGPVEVPQIAQTSAAFTPTTSAFQPAPTQSVFTPTPSTQKLTGFSQGAVERTIAHERARAARLAADIAALRAALERDPAPELPAEAPTPPSTTASLPTAAPTAVPSSASNVPSAPHPVPHPVERNAPDTVRDAQTAVETSAHSSLSESIVPDSSAAKPVYESLQAQRPQTRRVEIVDPAMPTRPMREPVIDLTVSLPARLPTDSSALKPQPRLAEPLAPVTPIQQPDPLPTPAAIDHAESAPIVSPESEPLTSLPAPDPIPTVEPLLDSELAPAVAPVEELPIIEPPVIEQAVIEQPVIAAPSIEPLASEKPAVEPPTSTNQPILYSPLSESTPTDPSADDLPRTGLGDLLASGSSTITPQVGAGEIELEYETLLSGSLPAEDSQDPSPAPPHAPAPAGADLPQPVNQLATTSAAPVAAPVVASEPPTPITWLPMSAKVRVEEVAGVASNAQWRSVDGAGGSRTTWRNLNVGDQLSGALEIRTGVNASIRLTVDERAVIRIDRLSRAIITRAAPSIGESIAGVNLTRGRIQIERPHASSLPLDAPLARVETPDRIITIQTPIAVEYNAFIGSRTSQE